MVVVGIEAVWVDCEFEGLRISVEYLRHMAGLLVAQYFLEQSQIAHGASKTRSSVPSEGEANARRVAFVWVGGPLLTGPRHASFPHQPAMCAIQLLSALLLSVNVLPFFTCPVLVTSNAPCVSLSDSMRTKGNTPECIIIVPLVESDGHSGKDAHIPSWDNL